MLPCRSTGRNSGPSAIPASSTQARMARTGHVAGIGAVGDADLAAGGVLVHLRPSHRDDEPFLAFLEVGDIEGDELAAAEGAREPEEQ